MRRAAPFGMAAAVALVGVAAKSAEPLPQSPVIPTMDSCRQFQVELQNELAVTFKRKAECLKGPVRFGRARECITTQAPRVVTTLQAWPQCDGEEERRCALYAAQDREVPACFHAAKGDAETKDRLLHAADEVSGQVEKIHDMVRTWNDPAEFYIRHVEPHMPAQLQMRRQLFLDSIDVPDGVTLKDTTRGPIVLQPFQRTFSSSGISTMQQTYDYLFAFSAGNERFYGGNPVIRAIQGAAANEIRKLHSHMIHELEKATAEIRHIAIDARGARVGKPVRSPASSGTHTDCSLLDGPERTRLSVEEPERYEALRERCAATR